MASWFDTRMPGSAFLNASFNIVGFMSRTSRVKPDRIPREIRHNPDYKARKMKVARMKDASQL